MGKYSVHGWQYWPDHREGHSYPVENPIQLSPTTGFGPISPLTMVSYGRDGTTPIGVWAMS